MRVSRTMKEVIKKFTKAVDAGETKVAQELVPSVYKAIDKAAKKGVIKSNTADRKKARLSKKLSTTK